MEKTYQPENIERQWYENWESKGYFRPSGEGESFSIAIPPPNVTGSLHMGHAFQHTIMDTLTRFKRMQGRNALWTVGTDHAGIATQMVTEREMALSQEPTRQDMGREKFLERVWQQKVKSRGTIIGQLKRLGASCDWDREAFTMGGAPGDPEPTKQNFHDAVIKVFVDMYDKGLIYRGKRLVNWDPVTGTALADDEVEMEEVDGHMWYLRYPLEDGDGHVTETVTSLVSSDRNFSSGMYKSGKVRIDITEPYGVNEFMYFLEGGVTLTSSDGTDLVINAGEAVTVPKEWTGVFETDGYMKIWVIYSPRE